MADVGAPVALDDADDASRGLSLGGEALCGFLLEGLALSAGLVVVAFFLVGVFGIVVLEGGCEDVR